MNTKEHAIQKTRGNANVSYLEQTVDQMIWNYMNENGIDGLTLAIVQAPYIPRIVGYGLSDRKQRRLASPNTMWPIGPISQAFAAVAVMQLHEDGLLELETPVETIIPEFPAAWRGITALQLLRHATGLPDYQGQPGWDAFKTWSFSDLLGLVKTLPLHFAPGTEVRLSATDFLVLTEIIERVSGKSYHDFVTERQIQYLGLRHTGFVEDLGRFHYEDVSLTENVHQLFKKDLRYIDPTEPAASYAEDGFSVGIVRSSALRGFSDIWASAQDVSFWDIGLAGSVLINKPENRALVYAPWSLPDGRVVPAVAGWHFYGHKGLMDIKGSVPGYSSFLSRFTDSAELVCVTLLANKGDLDLTNLGRRIAACFGDPMSTNYNDGRLFLSEGQFPVQESVRRLEKELERRGIPLFAKFDHARNAEEVGLELRPTTVLVFGSPKVGTSLMQADQSISLELPLRISIWEDEHGSRWLAFPRIGRIAAEYGLQDHPTVPKMETLMEDLVRIAGNIY